jgi:hypothetical protein
MSFTIRKNQRNPGCSLASFSNILGDHAVSVIIGYKFRYHLRIFHTRVMVWSEIGFPYKYLGWEHISGFDKFGTFQLIMKIPQSARRSAWSVCLDAME